MEGAVEHAQCQSSLAVASLLSSKLSAPSQYLGGKLALSLSKEPRILLGRAGIVY